MTTDPASSLPPPLAIGQRVRTALEVWIRLVQLASDLTQAIIAKLDEPALAANVPFITLLGLHLDGPMRPTAIGALTGLSSGGVSAALERLESLDLVVRDFGLVPGDRRAVVVRLTEKGHTTAPVIAELLDAMVDRLLVELGPEIAQRRAVVSVTGAAVELAATADRAGTTGPDATTGPDVTTTTPPAPEPAEPLHLRSRANLDLILRLVSVGEQLSHETQVRLLTREFGLNVTTLTLHALLVQGTLRPSEIGVLTGLSSGGVSALLERLETVGLVTRDFGLVPDDRRGVTVRLTEKGLHDLQVYAEVQTEPVERLLDELAVLAERRDPMPDAR